MLRAQYCTVNAFLRGSQPAHCARRCAATDQEHPIELLLLESQQRRSFLVAFDREYNFREAGGKEHYFPPHMACSVEAVGHRIVPASAPSH